jgi:hypothetical protein
LSIAQGITPRRKVECDKPQLTYVRSRHELSPGMPYKK